MLCRRCTGSGKWNFSLEGRMGTWLRHSKKWDFGNMYATGDAYTKVFGEHRNLLEDILVNDQLKWLAAMRHITVHNGGLAGRRRFLRLPLISIELSRFKKYDPVRPDEKVILDFVWASLISSIAIINFADDWLAAHPEQEAIGSA